MLEVSESPVPTHCNSTINALALRFVFATAYARFILIYFCNLNGLKGELFVIRRLTHRFDIELHVRQPPG